MVKNIEELFKCANFCANLKHSERLNSGVMVVQPSATVFNDMISKVRTLPSYTGGIMIFLFSHTSIISYYFIDLDFLARSILYYMWIRI